MMVEHFQNPSWISVLVQLPAFTISSAFERNHNMHTIAALPEIQIPNCSEQLVGYMPRHLWWLPLLSISRPLTICTCCFWMVLLSWPRHTILLNCPDSGLLWGLVSSCSFNRIANIAYSSATLRLFLCQNARTMRQTASIYVIVFAIKERVKHLLYSGEKRLSP